MKRGRKDLFTKNGREALKALYKDDGITKRTLQARYYQISAQWIISAAASEFPELNRLFHLNRTTETVTQKPEILEQLGRMYAQDGFGEENVIKIAHIAVMLLGKGWKVKEVKQYILDGRKSGEWSLV